MINLYEETRRIDQLRNRQGRILFLAPFVAIIGLAIVLWGIPVVFSIEAGQATEALQVTSESSPSRGGRGNATAESQNSPMPSQTLANPATIQATVTFASTANPEATNQTIQEQAVQDAIRGSR